MRRWERVDEDEVPIVDEEVPVADSEEVVESGEEVVAEDEEVVAGPQGDSALEYVYELRRAAEVPRTLTWLQLVAQVHRYKGMAKKAESLGMEDKAREWARLASRYARLAYEECPRRKRGGCPLTDDTTVYCPVDLERHCSMFMRWEGRPRKVRRYLRRKKSRK